MICVKEIEFTFDATGLCKLQTRRLSCTDGEGDDRPSKLPLVYVKLSLSMAELTFGFGTLSP